MEERLDLLESVVARQVGVITQQAERIAALEAENAELKARLGQNSSNSHKPPSSDPPGSTKTPSKPTGRKRGGQPGHEGAKRERLRADTVTKHRPTECRSCHEHLPKAAPAVEAKWCQVLELPEIRPHVAEHVALAVRCGCGTVTTGTLPDEALAHGFGPRMTAFVAYLTGRCRMSKRQVVEMLGDAFGTPIALGSVCALEKDVSEALAAPVEEARAAVRTQAVVHADETGWRENKQRAWLWVAVSTVATVFYVAKSRGSKVARELLGEGFSGRLVTDRWSAYTWVDALRRQLCWSHLIRDLQGMVERGGVGELYATRVLVEVRKLFEWWAQVRDGELERDAFRSRMLPIRLIVEELLLESSKHSERKTAGMCAEILKLKAALWTFVDHEGVEPTNNAAERAIRHAVLWRKGSFGNDSETGARFTERILTTVATVRQRGGNVLGYLADACASYRVTRTAPSLLAVGPCE